MNSGLAAEATSSGHLAFIPPQDLVSYRQLFLANNGGSINSPMSANAAQQVFIQSGLPTTTLATVWNLCAVNGGQTLSLGEFALGMFLVKLAMVGSPLPPSLPPDVREQILMSITPAPYAASVASRSTSGSYRSSLSPYSPSINSSALLSSQVAQPGNNVIMPQLTGSSMASSVGSFQQQQQQQHQQSHQLHTRGGAGSLRLLKRLRDRARQVFAQSGLSENILAHIWSLCDTHKIGKLNSDEFAVAMHIIYKKLNGHDVPITLPPELVPPSIRDLNELSAYAKSEAAKVQPMRRISPSVSLLGIHSESFNSKMPRSLSGSLAPPQLQSSNDSRRQQLLGLVEAKRKEISQLKEKIDSDTRECTHIEMSLQSLKEQSVKSQESILNLDQTKKALTTSLVNRVGDTANALSNTEISEFERLEREVLSLIDECKQRQIEVSDIKIVALRGKHARRAVNAQAGGRVPSGTGDVANKAAALLAARMAALGVTPKSIPSATPPPAVTPSLSSSSSTASLVDEISAVDMERLARLQELNMIQNRITIYATQIRSAINAQKASTASAAGGDWAPSVSDRVRFEEGVGLTSTSAISLIGELSKIRGSLVHTIVTPSTSSRPSVETSTSIYTANKPRLPGTLAAAFSSTPVLRSQSEGMASIIAKADAASLAAKDRSAKRAADITARIAAVTARSPITPHFLLMEGRRLLREHIKDTVVSMSPHLRSFQQPAASKTSQVSIAPSDSTPTTQPSFAPFGNPFGNLSGPPPALADAAPFSDQLVAFKHIDATVPTPATVFSSTNPFGISAVATIPSSAATSYNDITPLQPLVSVSSTRGENSAVPVANSMKSTDAIESHLQNTNASVDTQQTQARPASHMRSAEIVPQPSSSDSILPATTLSVFPSMTAFGFSSDSADYKPVIGNPFHITPSAQNNDISAVDTVDPAVPTLVSPNISAVSASLPPPPPPPPPPPLVQTTPSIPFKIRTSEVHPSVTVDAVAPPLSCGGTTSLLATALASHRGRMHMTSDTEDEGDGESDWESGSNISASPKKRSLRSPTTPLAPPLAIGTLRPLTATMPPPQPACTLSSEADAPIYHDDVKIAPTLILPIVGGSAPPPPPPPPPTAADGSVIFKRIPTHGSTSQSDSGSAVEKRRPTPAEVGARGIPIFALTGGAINPGALRSIANTSTLPKSAAKTSEVKMGSDAIVLNKATDTVSVSDKVVSTPVPEMPECAVFDANRLHKNDDRALDEWEMVHNGRHGVPDKAHTDTAERSLEGIAAISNSNVFASTNGTREDDLSVCAGDVVVIENEADEWLYCSIAADESAPRSLRTSGWVPKNFVDMTLPGIGATDSAASMDISDTIHPIGRARVMFDFNAQNSDEVSITVGSIVEILSKQTPEWWRVRSNTEQVGLAPCNYLEEIFNTEDDISDDHSRWNGTHDDGDDGHNGGGNHHAESAFPSHGSSLFSTGQSAPGDGTDTASLGSYGAQNGVLGQFGYTIDASSSTDSGDDLEHSTPVYDNNSPLTTASRSMAVSTDLLSHPPSTIEDRKRSDAIYEIIHTERNYVRDLQVVVEVFMVPMEDIVDARLVFANIRQVLNVNQQILADFERYASGESVESIGEIFLKYLDDLECYKGYCSNLSNASELLQRLRSEKSDLNSFLKSAQHNPRCKKLDLSSFLLVPMQRITRYSLLLRQMLHHTPKEHREHECTLIALQMSDELLEKLNAATKERQTQAKISELARTVDLSIPEEASLEWGFMLDLTTHTRLLGRRLFLHEGTLAKNKSGRKLQLYLFNDMMLFIHAKSSSGYALSLYRKPILLSDMIVREAVKTGAKDVGSIDKCCLQIVMEHEVITLRAMAVSDKRQWLNQIEAAVSAERSMKKRQLLGGSSDISTMGQPTIGTLEVKLHQAHGLGVIERGGRRLDVFAIVQVHHQATKSKRVHSSQPRWGQSLMFSVHTLDDVIKIALYGYNQYSKDEYLGQAQIQMDILEYYGGKATEVITLDLRDASQGKIEVQLMYRLAR
ncbi:hypothetical protein BSLG_002525 [Batrachochytrium salamandrivorans]|nr:hypothetical protein BSLG_002525 [Batrachochytrium salamandrivorans]